MTGWWTPSVHGVSRRIFISILQAHRGHTQSPGVRTPRRQQVVSHNPLFSSRPQHLGEADGQEHHCAHQAIIDTFLQRYQCHILSRLWSPLCHCHYSSIPPTLQLPCIALTGANLCSTSTSKDGSRCITDTSWSAGVRDIIWGWRPRWHPSSVE